MAEGYPTGNQVYFALGRKERQLAEDILQMAEKHWSVKGTVNIHKTGLLVRFSKPALAEFMRKEFGSRAVNKKIPSWIIEQRDPQPFLEGWLKGDGFKRGNTWRLTTSSKTAAYQAILMGSRLGILPAIYKDDRKERGIIKGERSTESHHTRYDSIKTAANTQTNQAT